MLLSSCERRDTYLPIDISDTSHSRKKVKRKNASSGDRLSTLRLTPWTDTSPVARSRVCSQSPIASVRDNLSTAALILEQHRAVFDFHGVGANVLGAGRTGRPAGRDMKLPLVQRAFDLFALDETVGEARLPLGAGGLRGENLAP